MNYSFLLLVLAVITLSLTPTISPRGNWVALVFAVLALVFYFGGTRW